MGFLAEHAEGYAQLALTNIEREFPAGVAHTMHAPGDFPSRPRERNPAFFGSYDWHSCVEMHWLLVRLLRTSAAQVSGAQIRRALDEHLSPPKLAVEARFMGRRADAARERPYGWGWALALAHEASLLDDEDGRRWARDLEPLAEVLTGNIRSWLGSATYPVRHGLHPNTAFGLHLALPYARARAEAGAPALLEAVTGAAMRWFGADRDYPGAWEPSAHDFLSPALVEAALMSAVLPGGRFGTWLSGFLPGIDAQEPAGLFAPVAVGDASDGQTAHLHGLNLSRAWAWRFLAARLPESDARVPVMQAAAARHAEAALPHVIGDDYMVEHWLAAYAVLYLTAD